MTKGFKQVAMETDLQSMELRFTMTLHEKVADVVTNIPRLSSHKLVMCAVGFAEHCACRHM